MPAKAGTQRLSVPSRHSRFRGNDGEGSRTMNTAVTDYPAHLEVERRMSAPTLDAYRRDLAALSEWAQAQGIVDLETLDRKSVVWGRWVSARVDPGGRRIRKKKNKRTTT